MGVDLLQETLKARNTPESYSAKIALDMLQKLANHVPQHARVLDTAHRILLDAVFLDHYEETSYFDLSTQLRAQILDLQKQIGHWQSFAKSSASERLLPLFQEIKVLSYINNNS